MNKFMNYPLLILKFKRLSISHLGLSWPETFLFENVSKVIPRGDARLMEIKRCEELLHLHW